MKRRLRPESSFLICLLAATSCTGRDISLGEGRVQSEPGVPDLSRFGAPRLIAGLDAEDAKDDDPALTADLLLLYFNSQREGGQGQEDIWFAQRSDRDQAFSEPVAERALNSEQRETGLALSLDGLSLWFSSDRKGGEGGLDIYLATRGSLRDSWSVARVDALSSSADDLVSSLADAERSLFLARRDSDDDDYDLFVARRPDRTRGFIEPESIESLNSAAAESDAVWLEAELGLVFTRDGDLVHAPGYPEDRGPVLLLSVLNSDDDDRDAWFSPDLRYVVFSSDRSGSYRLYEAELPP